MARKAKDIKSTTSGLKGWERNYINNSKKHGKLLPEYTQADFNSLGEFEPKRRKKQWGKR